MKQKIKREPPQQGPRIHTHSASDKSPQQLPPIFSFEYLHHDAKYCLSRCERDEKAQFADRLLELSRLTWAQIMNAPRGGLGCEKIGAHEIKGRVHEEMKSDHYLAFRCIGRAPMVGKRVDRVFYIIWIDRDFTLYDHG